jgi:hypothetical protein
MVCPSFGCLGFVCVSFLPFILFPLSYSKSFLIFIIDVEQDFPRDGLFFPEYVFTNLQIIDWVIEIVFLHKFLN